VSPLCFLCSCLYVSVYPPRQDGTKVLTASCDKTCKLWDLQSNQAIDIAQHSAPVKCVHWIQAPNYSCAITGSWDKTVKLWDTRSPNPVLTMQLPERCYSMDVVRCSVNYSHVLFLCLLGISLSPPIVSFLSFPPLLAIADVPNGSSEHSCQRSGRVHVRGHTCRVSGTVYSN